MFADFLKAYRKDADLTQEELAAKCPHISRGHLAKMEAGQRGPSPEQLRELVAALGLEASPAERKRFELAGMEARAEQDADLGPFVKELRTNQRLTRERLKLAVTLLARVRDNLSRKGIELPKDLNEAIDALQEES